MSAPQSSYVMLPENYAGGVPPPPYRRNIPRYESISNQKREGNCCLRCICYCYCFLFILIFVCAGVLFYFYVVMQPQMPSYQVQALEVKAFNVQMDFSLNTEFLVTVKAENPNKNIGFIYGKDSSVTVSYTDSTLCSGKLPINIVLGEIQMRQFVVHVNCSLVVDNLSPNKKIGILSSNYTVGFTA
uniref:Late embryogenesis abundant protein LEA-2 subgroup domain-containing protein n=1 Tax=Davidia involucrata TaxID=16924 RepID=A0A5B7B5F0_DAVIN